MKRHNFINYVYLRVHFIMLFMRVLMFPVAPVVAKLAASAKINRFSLA